MSLQPLFEAGKFIITTEVGPPKGTDIAELEEARRRREQEQLARLLA